MEKNKLPEGVVFLNYKQSSNTNIPAVTDIPIGNKEILDKLTQGDPSPMFKSEAIDFPVIGTGGVYEKSFFKSFINVCKERPIPGSKRGHEYSSRPANDFYMVGGQLIENADGKSGTAVFLMYIPPFGDTTDNTGFKRDADAGIVNFSLVTQPEYNIKKDEDGVERRHFTKTNGYERNDAVEYGAGAMAQVVNSKSATDTLISANVTKAKSLINSGKIDSTSSWSFSAADGDKLLGANGDDWANYEKWFLVQDTSATDETKERYKYPYGKNGKVYRSALRAIASRAATAGLQDVSDTASELIKLMDKKKNERNLMDEELKEAVERVQNAAKNGSIVIADVFKNAGIALRTDDDKKNEELVKALNAKNLGADPLKEIDSIIAQNKANADAIVKNEVAAKCGQATMKNAKGEDVPNPAYDYALEKCAGKTGDVLKNELDAVMASNTMKILKSNMADPFSKINMIENGGGADTNAKNAANVAVAY